MRTYLSEHAFIDECMQMKVIINIISMIIIKSVIGHWCNYKKKQKMVMIGPIWNCTFSNRYRHDSPMKFGSLNVHIFMEPSYNIVNTLLLICM